MKDKMTHKERMAAFSKGEEIDRIPITVRMGEPAVTLYGVSMHDYAYDPKVMTEVEVNNFRKFGFDSASISISLRGLAEAMGSVIEYGGRNIPYVSDYFVKTLEDIDKLEVIDPLKDGRIPLVIEAYDRIVDEIGDEIGVGFGLAGPISVAANLCGAENMLRWCVKAPEAVEKMLDIITESNNAIIDEMAKRGSGISFSDPVSSTSLLRKKQFDRFSLPFFQRNVDHVIEKINKKPGLHVCGKSKELWDDLSSTGISNFSIDNIEDLAEAKEIMGDKVVITGNVPPFEVLNIGNREMIFNSVRECIKKAWDSPKGFILCSGCQVPMNTPAENFQSFKDAGVYYGTYPIDLEKLEKEYKEK